MHFIGSRFRLEFRGICLLYSIFLPSLLSPTVLLSQQR